MKCKTCNIEISPKFVMAIRNNKCPACGGMIVSENGYKKIFFVQEQLAGLEIEEGLLFGIAASLAAKFTLVPADLILEDDEEHLEEGAPVNLKKPPKNTGSGIKRVDNAKSMSPPKATSIEEPLEETDDLSEAEKLEIEKEWGMNAVSSGESFSDGDSSEFQGMFGGVGLELEGATQHGDLLQRASNANSNKKIKRVDS